MMVPIFTSIGLINLVGGDIQEVKLYYYSTDNGMCCYVKVTWICVTGCVLTCVTGCVLACVTGCVTMT